MPGQRTSYPPIRCHPSTGYVTTFARAGFEIIASQTPPRPIMRHNLKNIAPLAVNKPSRQ